MEGIWVEVIGVLGENLELADVAPFQDLMFWVDSEFVYVVFGSTGDGDKKYTSTFFRAM